jgi:hypothetical protein
MRHTLIHSFFTLLSSSSYLLHLTSLHDDVKETTTTKMYEKDELISLFYLHTASYDMLYFILHCCLHPKFLWKSIKHFLTFLSWLKCERYKITLNACITIKSELVKVKMNQRVECEDNVIRFIYFFKVVSWWTKNFHVETLKTQFFTLQKILLCKRERDSSKMKAEKTVNKWIQFTFGWDSMDFFPRIYNIQHVHSSNQSSLKLISLITSHLQNLQSIFFIIIILFWTQKLVFLPFFISW